MDKISNLALIAQMIDSAEKNIQSAKQLLREMMGGPASKNNIAHLAERATTFSVSEGGKIIEVYFDIRMVEPQRLFVYLERAF